MGAGSAQKMTTAGPEQDRNRTGTGTGQKQDDRSPEIRRIGAVTPVRVILQNRYRISEDYPAYVPVPFPSFR
jgi:hypothetical protein